MKLLRVNAPGVLCSLGTAVGLSIALSMPAVAQGYTPEQRAGWCKNEVMSQYNTNRADVSITGEQGRAVSWRIGSTGRTGRCVFNNQNIFVRLESASTRPPYRATGQIYWNAQARQWVAPDGGVCATCTAANGFPNPPNTRSGYFYLPSSRMWYDPDGRACHTCTPQNGFPVPR